MKPDYTLCLVTDRRCLSDLTLCEAVEQAILGGCTMIQLREGSMDGAFYRLAREVKQITDAHGVPLLINNRADIALAADAAGVHVGQKDLPASAARRLLGKEKLLGVSVTTVQEARQAEADGADYLGVGAMFPTNTKQDAVLVSMETLQAIRQAVSLPVVVIGGINRENASLFRKMGADGLAVVSAVLAQPDIWAAAKALRQTF